MDRLPGAGPDDGVEEAAVGPAVASVEGEVAGEAGDRIPRTDGCERGGDAGAVAGAGLDGAAEEERRVIGVGIEPSRVVAVGEAEARDVGADARVVGVGVKARRERGAERVAAAALQELRRDRL